MAISTPAATHVTLTQEALRLGLAVACGKPFAPYAGSARQTIELAGQRAARQRIAGRADRLRVAVRAVQARSRPPAADGGTLLDFGSHLADQALVLAGPVSGVYAEMHYRSELGGLDDDFFIALTHEGGVRSHLGAASCCRSR